MEVCKSEQIASFCHPNALMTLKEYLIDYASDSTKALGVELINQEAASPLMQESPMRLQLERNLDRITDGERDLRF